MSVTLFLALMFCKPLDTPTAICAASDYRHRLEWRFEHLDLA